jgi:hypothetical protein
VEHRAGRFLVRRTTHRGQGDRIAVKSSGKWRLTAFCEVSQRPISTVCSALARRSIDRSKRIGQGDPWGSGDLARRTGACSVVATIIPPAHRPTTFSAYPRAYPPHHDLSSSGNQCPSSNGVPIFPRGPHGSLRFCPADRGSHCAGTYINSHSPAHHFFHPAHPCRFPIPRVTILLTPLP